jgi:hypothetical protein
VDPLRVKLTQDVEATRKWFTTSGGGGLSLAELYQSLRGKTTLLAVYFIFF